MRTLACLLIGFFFVGSPMLLWAQVSSNTPNDNDTNDSIPAAWWQLIQQGSNDPVVVQQAFEQYYQQHPFIKNQQTQTAKRWLRQWARRPAWERMSADEKRQYQQYQQLYLQQYQQQQQGRNNTANWQGIGPYDFDQGSVDRSYSCGSAHIYTVEQAKSNPNTLYAGSATAGVWKTTDKGKNWTAVTRDLWIETVRALAIDPLDDQVVYIGSDLDGKVYKTTNGGTTWTLTGDSAFQQLNVLSNDIVAHPSLTNTIFLASSQGLYRSTNAGQQWQLIESGTFQEIEFHPYEDSIVYATKQVSNRTEFYKSTDYGLTFTQKTNGWPLPAAVLEDQRRTEIAISPADSNLIYAVLTGDVGFVSGLYNILVSRDAGESWNPLCCGAKLPNYPSASNPNLMHWLTNGTGNGGQYYYDLALAAAPNNADNVLLGGVNLWFSNNGADSFYCPAVWNESFKPNYVHADIHDIRFYGSEIWVACDGGIFYSIDNGQNFQRRVKGIEGTDFWGFGAGFNDGEVMLGGTFHNGTMLKDHQVYENDWLSTNGGDNYRGFVHPIYTRQMYSDFGATKLSGNRLIPNNTQAFLNLPHAGVTVGFSGNLAFHPQEYNTLYSTDYYRLWRSNDLGLNWELVADFGTGLLTSLEISWANPQVLYLNYHPNNPNADRKIFRSTDSGYQWTDITPNTNLIPNDRWVTYDLTLNPKNADELWAARVSKYEGSPILNGAQVFHSTDGGQSWQNHSKLGLDGVYATNIVHQKGSNGGLYLGTRTAVYYTNDTLNEWILYNQGLPARTHSVQLVPYYGGGNLRNGTNRSVYQTAFYTPSQPVAQISVDKASRACPRDTFYFASQSAAQQGATYQWQFEQGSPNSSTAERPKVVFAQAGSYSVTLTVTDAQGSDTQVLSNFIEVEDWCQKDTLPGYALQLAQTTDYAISPPIDLQTSTLTISAWIKPDGIQAPFTGIVTHANDSFPAGLLFGNQNELLFQWQGGQWTWNSGLIVPSQEWSHVAVVIYPDSAILYLNGMPSVYAATLGNFYWKDGIVIGRYADWFSRTFKGLIDEVCIWEEALDQTSLRKSMHLTQYDQQPFVPRHYYQFNAPNARAQDKNNLAHATLVGGAQRVPSTAPVGGGRSQMLPMTTARQYNFAQANAYLAWETSSPLADGELIVNRLNVPPDTTPNPLSTGGYWIINHYGQQATPPDSIQLSAPTAISPPSPTAHWLQQRADRADGATWSTGVDTAQVLQQNSISFYDLGNLNAFGQWLVVQDSNWVLPTPKLPNLTTKPLVYPNPLQVGQPLQLQTAFEGVYEFLLYDQWGRILMQQELSAKASSLLLPKLTAGVYLYEVRQGKQAYRSWLRCYE